MKSKKLVYICIGVGLLVACVGLIYNSLDTGSDIAENSSKVNNTSSVNSSDTNVTENNTNNSTNEIAFDNNIKSSNGPVKKNQPKNIPKNSKLSYSKAYSIAASFKGSDNDPHNLTYVKYNGYEYEDGVLYWKFNMYFKKTNEWLGEIRVIDATGHITLD